MHRPTTRVLAVLELLQARRRISGVELARRLEVDERTVRRYVATLQELGVPVEGERGRYGAYALRPGYKLPPLMFTDEEAVGLGLALFAARNLGLAGVVPAVEGAFAKVERVMPEALRERLDLLEHTILAVAPPEVLPDGESASRVAGAVGERRRVRMRYRSARGEQTQRVVDPYALLRGEGRWYVFGYDHLREDARLFRLDRVLGAEVLEEVFDRPPGLEDPGSLLGAVANSHAPWGVEVLLETTMQRARVRVPPMLASLEEAEDGVVLRSTTPSLNEMARVLSGLFCPFVVRHPPELRAALRRHAEEILILADRTEGEATPDLRP